MERRARAAEVEAISIYDDLRQIHTNSQASKGQRRASRRQQQVAALKTPQTKRTVAEKRGSSRYSRDSENIIPDANTFRLLNGMLSATHETLERPESKHAKRQRKHHRYKQAKPAKSLKTGLASSQNKDLEKLQQDEKPSEREQKVFVDESRESNTPTKFYERTNSLS